MYQSMSTSTSWQYNREVYEAGVSRIHILVIITAVVANEWLMTMYVRVKQYRHIQWRSASKLCLWACSHQIQISVNTVIQLVQIHYISVLPCTIHIRANMLNMFVCRKPGAAEVHSSAATSSHMRGVAYKGFQRAQKKRKRKKEILVNKL